MFAFFEEYIDINNIKGTRFKIQFFLPTNQIIKWHIRKSVSDYIRSVYP